MTRARAEEYRRLAQECLTAARLASTGEARVASLEMARTWFRLAEEQEDESANIEVSISPIPGAQSQPAAQQQQVQPKDEVKNR